ncbi:MAG: asparagine synthase (glutamine-hydrolyzing) [Terriglobia bacterium]
MCGIVGAVVFTSSPFQIEEPYLVRMRDTMHLRGPDGQGAWISPNRKVGLGHRRLSIIDLSDAASQPMSNEDGTMWVSFNGEIYNHAEIRAELESLGGHRWKTDHSDTEVILHAFEQWGIDCVERFRGMFAIALWDESRQELWLIRDRLGIKPLYYSVHHQRFTFASEIKALLQDPEQPRAVNEEGFYHYLSFLTVPAPQTLFEGIRKLPCGTWLKVDREGRLTEQRYWDVWDHAQPLKTQNEKELSELILSELRTAVRIHKVSDVPVGVFLSGGIDSSVNAALFSESGNGQVKTFSIGYQGGYQSTPDELPYARMIAEKVHADHHERLLSARDLIDFLPEMIRLQDEPIADPVCVPVYYVSKLAREHGVVVCQVGEGADELFWGYPGWKDSLRLQSYDDWPVPNSLKRVGLAGLRVMGKDNGFPYEWLRRGAENLPIFWGGAEAFTETGKKKLLSRRLQARFTTYSSWEALRPLYRRFKETAWDTSHLNWMTYLDLNLRLPELLLMRVDKMSMGVSLEGRVPFLDHRFVEVAMGIPAAAKTKHGTLKYLLKKAVRGVIPDELIDRRKQGFGVPIYEWFFGELGQRARQDLNQYCESTDLLNPVEVNRLMDQGYHSQAWVLLNFALWWKEYIA